MVRRSSRTRIRNVPSPSTRAPKLSSPRCPTNSKVVFEAINKQQAVNKVLDLARFGEIGKIQKIKAKSTNEIIGYRVLVKE